MKNYIQTKISDFFSDYMKFLAEDNKERKEKKGQYIYSSFWWISIRTGLMIFCFYLIWGNIFPKYSVNDIIEFSNGYHPVKLGKVFFGKTKPWDPEFSSGKNDFSFDPDGFEIRKMPNFDKMNIWYEFNLPDLNNGTEQPAVFIPPIQGKGTIYLNGKFLAHIYGQSRLYDLNESGVLHINVYAKSEDSIKFGIRSLVPIVIGPSNKLVQLINMMDGSGPDQALVTMTLIGSFCLLFLMIFHFSKTKPEIFGFGCLLFSSTLYGLILYSKFVNPLKFIDDSIGYNFLSSLIALTMSCFLINFIFDYVRIFRKAIAIYKLIPVITLVLIGVSLMFGVLSQFKTIYFDFSILVYTSALLISVFVLVSSHYFIKNIVRHQLRANYIIFLSLSTFVYVIWLIYGTMVQSYMVTSEYANSIFLFYTLAIVISLDSSRKEEMAYSLSKVLPYETREKMDNPNLKDSWSEGFIIHVDMLGYSEIIDSLSEYQKISFLRNILIFFMNKFSNKNKLAEGGDSLFLASRGENSISHFLDICMTLQRLFKSNKKLSDILDNTLIDKPLKFRASLSYGRYSTLFVESGEQAIKGVVSSALNHSAKIIGDEKSQYLRVELNEYTQYIQEFLSDKTEVIKLKVGNLSFEVLHITEKMLDDTILYLHSKLEKTGA